jgi:hypothetical protein
MPFSARQGFFTITSTPGPAKEWYELNGDDFKSNVSTWTNDGTAPTTEAVVNISSSGYNRNATNTANAVATHRGACLGTNDKIYIAPFNYLTNIVSTIIVCDTTTDTLSNIDVSSELTATQPYLAPGVLASNGKIYWAPCNYSKVMILDTADDSVTFQDWGVSDLSSGTGKYASAVLGPDNKIYAWGGSKANCLVIDPAANTAYSDNFSGTLPSSTTNGRIGASRHPDNNTVVFGPYQNASFGIIDTASNSAYSTSAGTTILSQSCQGLAAMGSGNVMYAPHNNESDIIELDNGNVAQQVNVGFPATPKFLASYTGPDGNIWLEQGFTSTSNAITYYDGTNDTKLSANGWTSGDGAWSGAVAPNGYLYVFSNSIPIMQKTNLRGSVTTDDADLWAKFCYSSWMNSRK